jgi:hypothetical protein
VSGLAKCMLFFGLMMIDDKPVYIDKASCVWRQDTQVTIRYVSRIFVDTQNIATVRDFAVTPDKF